jgi:class 3 adenylate cyclase
MGEDEAATHARLRAHRKDFVEPLVAEHRGRVVRLTGDGILVEFASAADAVECAVALQSGITGRRRCRGAQQRRATYLTSSAPSISRAVDPALARWLAMPRSETVGAIIRR